MGLSSRNRKIAPACDEQAGSIRGAKMSKEAIDQSGHKMITCKVCKGKLKYPCIQWFGFWYCLECFCKRSQI